MTRTSSKTVYCTTLCCTIISVHITFSGVNHLDAPSTVPLFHQIITADHNHNKTTNHTTPNTRYTRLVQTTHKIIPCNRHRMPFHMNTTMHGMGLAQPFPTCFHTQYICTHKGATKCDNLQYTLYFGGIPVQPTGRATELVGTPHAPGVLAGTLHDLHDALCVAYFALCVTSEHT
jgi:hypothetical protein